MALSKEDILGAKDAGVAPVEIPEWGGTYYLRVLTGPELDALTAAQQRLGGERSTSPSRMAAEVLGRCLCDEDGKRLFADDEIGAIAAKSAKVLNRVAQTALDFNGLSDQAAAAVKGN